MIKQIHNIKVDIAYKSNMKNIRFKYIDGVLIVTSPKISYSVIEKLILDNYLEIETKVNESKLSNNYTYINGNKIEIVYINEKYKNIILEDKKLYAHKDNIDKLIKEYFINIVSNFINKTNLSNHFNNYPAFKVRKLKSSFGQYNKKTHTITLDYRLAKYEECFIYLTLVHELCHIIHFDHSKDFYDLLDNFVPNSKKAHKIMKKIKYNDIF